MPSDNIKGFRKDTLALLKQLDSPVYRWPGGNFVSGYDWKDGVGPRDKRPPRTNPAWTGMEYNDVGLHEFMDLCRLLDTEPYIAVNTGLGTAEDAAKEVAYCNGALDTPMGQWRSKNGHADSYKVKFWAVGNEMYGGWQLGHMPLKEYVKKHNEVAEAMWRADPEIQLVAVGAVGPWSEETLKNCADHMTHISEHFYCQDGGGIVAHAAQVPNQIKRIADAHRRYRETIGTLEGKDIRIALDEWNYWYGPHPYGELGTRYFHKDAIGIARGLHEYFRNSDVYFMANYAQTVNVIGCIKTTKTDAFFAATGLPLKLYRERFGTLPMTVDGSNDSLDVMAALTADKKALTIGVVNASWDTHRLGLDFKGLKPIRTAEHWFIADKNPLAYNDPDNAKNLAIQKGRKANMNKTLVIKPLSINLYRVPVK
jgi:alpha-L-arabinofuranosidase